MDENFTPSLPGLVRLAIGRADSLKGLHVPRELF